MFKNDNQDNQGTPITLVTYCIQVEIDKYYISSHESKKVLLPFCHKKYF